MGNVKRGNNLYVVITAVTSGNMATAFANLVSATLFFRKASTTPNGISATQSYQNPDYNPFPSYDHASVGDIVSIAGLTAEVDIPVLGEANVVSVGGGGNYSDYQTFVASAGQTDYVLTGNPPADVSRYRVRINDEPSMNSENGLTFSISALSGSNRTITITPGPLQDGDVYKIDWILSAS